MLRFVCDTVKATILLYWTVPAVLVSGLLIKGSRGENWDCSRRDGLGSEAGLRLSESGTMSMTQEMNKCNESQTMDVNDVSQVDGTVERKGSTTSEGNLIGGPNSKCEPASITAHARDWFTKLSSEERSGATSFSDGAFLGAFLAFASPWSQHTNETENHRICGSGGVSRGEY